MLFIICMKKKHKNYFAALLTSNDTCIKLLRFCKFLPHFTKCQKIDQSIKIIFHAHHGYLIIVQCACKISWLKLNKTTELLVSPF